MSYIKCPYCRAELEICYDDGQGLSEDELYEKECSQCEKVFVFDTHITISHEAYRADCLNGGEHKWEKTITIPKRFTKMECKECGDRRTPTEEEMQKILKEE